MGDTEYDLRVQHCRDCILSEGCTRKTVYATDGYCWADHIILESGERISKEELARRHNLL